MGSGGAQTLWSPSNKAGAVSEIDVFNRCAGLAGDDRPPSQQARENPDKAVIDGGILKHELSY
jgi:hypothetical protein